MIKIQNPLNSKGYRILCWMTAILGFVGIFGKIPPRDGADVLVSILCGLICIGMIWQLMDFYRKDQK